MRYTRLSIYAIALVSYIIWKNDKRPAAKPRKTRIGPWRTNNRLVVSENILPFIFIAIFM